MSIKLMSQIWDSTEEEGTPLLVWLKLADHSNDEGKCWPSIMTIARKCRISDRYASEIIAGLKARGRIGVVYRPGQSTMYQVFAPEPQFTPESRSSEPQFTTTLNPSSPGDEPQFTGVVNPSSPRTVIEPSTESSFEPSGGSARKTARPPAKENDEIRQTLSEVLNMPLVAIKHRDVQSIRELEPGMTDDALAAEVEMRFGSGSRYRREAWQWRRDQTLTIKIIREEWKKWGEQPDRDPLGAPMDPSRYLENNQVAEILGAHAQ